MKAICEQCGGMKEGELRVCNFGMNHFFCYGCIEAYGFD